MDYTSLAAYFLALTVFLVAPGPLMAVLIGRSIGSDSRGAVAFAAGLCTGNVLVASAVVMGAGLWAAGRPELLSLAKYAGVAYLLWLAMGMWNTDANLKSRRQVRGGWLASVSAGVALCIGAPSILLFYMLVLPSVAPAGEASLDQLVLLLLATLASAIAVFFGTVLLAGQFSRILASPTSSSMFSRLAAIMTAATAVWILAA